MFLDKNGYLYGSDIEKHEIRRWKIGRRNGILVAGGNRKDDRLDQFNEPRYLFVDENESIYISDRGNHPNGIIVDQSGIVYIVDYVNNRMICWLKDTNEGQIFVGGNGKGNQRFFLKTEIA